jgi:hypothetical protein
MRRPSLPQRGERDHLDTSSQGTHAFTQEAEQSERRRILTNDRQVATSTFKDHERSDLDRGGGRHGTSPAVAYPPSALSLRGDQLADYCEPWGTPIDAMPAVGEVFEQQGLQARTMPSNTLASGVEEWTPETLGEAADPELHRELQERRRQAGIPDPVSCQASGTGDGGVELGSALPPSPSSIRRRF